MADDRKDSDAGPGAADTPGSLPPEPVENRQGVGSVSPDDYPDAAESDATGSGTLSPPGLDDDMDFERRNPGS